MRLLQGRSTSCNELSLPCALRSNGRRPLMTRLYLSACAIQPSRLARSIGLHQRQRAVVQPGPAVATAPGQDRLPIKTRSASASQEKNAIETSLLTSSPHQTRACPPVGRTSTGQIRPAVARARARIPATQQNRQRLHVARSVAARRVRVTDCLAQNALKWVHVALHLHLIG